MSTVRKYLQANSYIVFSRNLWRIEFFVIRPAGGDVEPSTTDSPEKHRIVDLKLDDAIDRLTTFLQKVVQLKQNSNSS